jgi:hypothetical protein
MKVFIARYIAVVALFINTAIASPDKLFLDFINYSASIDGYSSLCIKNYNDEKEMTNLFSLLDEIKSEYLLITNDDYNMLKSAYIKTKSATISQLMKLKLNSQKKSCNKYLRIFERFDRKKQESLEDLEKIINGY